MEKLIVVTGATRGLGISIATCLLNAGYAVIGVSRNLSRDFETLQKSYPKHLKFIPFDLSEPENIQGFYKEKLRPLGPIYALVNNAGWAYDDLCTNANLDKLHWMFNINVFSAIMLSKFVIRDFLLNNVRGSLVHISSVSTKNGFKGLSMYAATKGALEVFSMGVAREWGSIGVRSNCIAPGFMETEMSQSLDDEQRLKIYRRTALGRAVDLSSVAEMTLFLVDEEKSNSITGSVFYIDGGN